MKPAGLDASEGVLSAGYLKDASDPQWKDDEGMKKFMAFNSPEQDAGREHRRRQYPLWLRRGADHGAGDEAGRRPSDARKRHEQAASLKDFAPGTLFPGIKINTGPDRFRADRTAQDDAVQERPVGAVRRHHQRRDGGIGPAPGYSSWKCGRLVGGGFAHSGLAFSSEVDSGSREESASKQESQGFGSGSGYRSGPAVRER